MTDMTATLDPQLALLDPARERLREVEDLLQVQADAGRSSLEAALAGLIAAGGKRIRPRVALLAGGMLEAEEGPLVCLAAAIEMLHTASLVHDDLIDGSVLRRGLATLNARWSAGASVMVGDFALTRATALMLGTRRFAAVEMFTRTIAAMVDGEITQLARERGIQSREEDLRWIGAKTAALFELAAGAPALLGPAGEAEFAAARRFGYGLGMAFQIVDDVLDYTGDPARLGKPVGSDLSQGVLTLPALIYLEDHPGEPDLVAVAHRERRERGAIEALVDRIRRSSAIEVTLDLARGYVRGALEDLWLLPDGPERLALEEIARGIVERDS